jgi:tetratricopeptide (TPR) repeat protein
MAAVIKRLSSRLSRTVGLSEAPPDNPIVRFLGVSLRSLKELRERIEQEKEAVAVELYRLKAPSVARVGKTVPAGTSVRLVSRISDKTLLCYAPYIGLVEVEVAGADKKKRTEWSTEEVAEHVVKTCTQSFNGFFLDILPPADVGGRFQGTFVSQARAMRFGDLVDGLLEHFKAAKADPRTAFVWLDILSANQPLLTTSDIGVAADIKQARADLITSGMHGAIQNFADRVLFFNSWDDPLPLRRAWCVWEIFGAIKSGKPLALVFPPGEEKRCLDIVVEDPDEIDKHISKLDLEKAGCYSADDKAMIDKAVRSTVGYHALNVKISHLLQEHLRRFLDSATLKLTDSARTTDDKLRLSLTLHQVGTVVKKQGDYASALRYYEGSLRIDEAEFGSRDFLSVAFTVHQIGNVLLLKGDFAGALEQYREAQRITKLCCGEDDPSVATAMFGSASVSVCTGDFAGARKLFEVVLQMYAKAFGVRKAQGQPHRLSLGKKQVSSSQAPGGNDKVERQRQLRLVAATLHCLGYVARSLGDVESALKYYERTLLLLDEAIATGDYDVVAATKHGIGSALASRGDYKDALALYKDAARIYEKVFGTRCRPEVATTLRDTGQVLMKLGDSAGADACFAEACSIDGTQGNAATDLHQTSVRMAIPISALIAPESNREKGEALAVARVACKARVARAARCAAGAGRARGAAGAAQAGYYSYSYSDED